MCLEPYGGRLVQFKVIIASYQYLFDMQGFTDVCGYTYLTGSFIWQLDTLLLLLPYCLKL